MSISREKREEIKRYILRHIQIRDKNYIAKTIEAYEISRTTVYKYLKQLETDGAIKITDDDSFKYSLVIKNKYFSFSTKDTLEEDRIFNRDIMPFTHARRSITASEPVTDVIKRSRSETLYRIRKAAMLTASSNADRNRTPTATRL